MTAEEITARERRLSTWVGLAGMAAVGFFLASMLARSQTAVGEAETAAEQLRAFDSEPTGFLVSQALNIAALIALAFVLIAVFRAAHARSDRVNGALLPLAVVGPGLFAVVGIVGTIGLLAASSDFADLPTQDVGGRAELRELDELIAERPEEISQLLLLTDTNTVEYEIESGAFVSAEYPERSESELESSAEAAGIDVETDEGTPGELRAREVITDSAFELSRLLVLPAGIALAVIAFYVARWALRTGLQTTFWGTFGMAAGVVTILLGPIGPLIWALNAGLVAAGWTARRPPAWEAGVAIPWPKPGEEPEREPPIEEPARPEDFDASARELSGEGEGEAEGGGRPGRRENRRKRKRKQRGS